MLVEVPEDKLRLITEQLPAHSWRIRRGEIVIESRTGPSYLNTYIDEIWPIAETLFATLARFEIVPSSCILRLVEYVGKEEEQGGSFWLDAPWIEALAKQGGVLDVDIYVGPFPASSD